VPLESPIPADRLQVSLLREQVPDLLRQAIVEMRLKPGDRLVERELVEWTGVSRATVREALRQLAAEGLVKTIPQKGAVVAAPTRKEAAELYEIRALLEGLAARQFTERASDQEVKALREAFHELERVWQESADARSMLQSKNRFYDVLFRGADNATIGSVLGLLQARIAVLRATSMSQPGRPTASVEEIRAIVEAVEVRDAAAAGLACSHHVTEAGRWALEALASSSNGDRGK
jgi:GntR family transcriptional regulator, trigonelline degradation regulator